MDPSATRILVNQLADDLGWLEQHCGKDASRGFQTGQLRLAASLVRNCIGPLLDGQAPLPLHVVVVGGAGAGKSTVANFLSGVPAAEANPQAGFTRHPVAFTSGNGALNWAGHLGFLGPLRRLDQPGPSSLDADVFQVRRVSTDAASTRLLEQFVVWDCPDMTTWAASGYIPRLLEVAGLADVVVYVASDERYNDEVPTQFLSLLLKAGKPVNVCLTKVRESDAPTLLEHFRNEVAGRMPSGLVAQMAIPYLKPEELADPLKQAGRYRIPLINQVGVLGDPPSLARARTVRGAMYFLGAAQDELLGAVRSDMYALEGWRGVVQAGQAEFDQRYRREYLATEKFQQFDESLVRLLELLELPGIGKFIGGTLRVLRMPYNWVMGLVGKAITRPEAKALPEQPVLQAALTAWLDLLRKEAARQSDTHPLWRHVESGFNGTLVTAIREQFQQGFQAFRQGLSEEVERTARALYEDIEKNPTLLNTLRGGKLAIDVGAIAGAVALGGPGWHDLILVPLASSVSQHLIELFGKQYVESQREQARTRQLLLMQRHISGPTAEWLIRWPATGGSAFERLQTVLRRIPEAIHRLEEAVGPKLAALEGG